MTTPLVVNERLDYFTNPHTGRKDAVVRLDNAVALGMIGSDGAGGLIIPEDNTNYTQIESDGTVIFHGAATVFDDVYPSSVTVSTGATAPSFSAFGGSTLKAYEFTGGASNKELHIGYQIPHSYQEGTSIYPHLHLFITNSAPGGTVRFDMDYEWANVDDTGTISVTTINQSIALPNNSTTYRNRILAFPAITGTGKKISSVFMSKITRRQDLDTFSGSVWLLSADIHIAKNSVGSRQEYIK